MKKIIFFIILIVALILLYARYVEPYRLSTNEYSIKSEILTESYNGFKIVHFSDLHYNSITDKDYLDKLIKEINLIKPDIVVFTGDLYSISINDDDKSILKQKLGEIDSKYGKYAILGNEDIKNKDSITEIYAYSSFILLDNSYNIIYNNNNDKIFIGGTSSYQDKPNIDEVMSYFTTNDDIAYKIILVHEPDTIKNILDKHNNISLILGGHTHGGSLNIPYLKKYYSKDGAHTYYKKHYTKNNTQIYISSGIGNNSPYLRLFNPPEVNLYRITKKD